MMQDEALAAEIGARFDHVLVDEYQDTNVLQAEILQRLKPSGQGLTVVGDDAQAIYSFRAATVENIRGFEKQFGAGDRRAGGELPLDAAGARFGQRAHRQEPVLEEEESARSRATSRWRTTRGRRSTW